MRRSTITLGLLVAAICCRDALGQDIDDGSRVLRVTGGDLSTQQLTGFPLGKWNNDDHLWWQNGRAGDTLVIELPVKTAGRQEVRVVLTRATDYGIVQFHLDGQKIGKPIDLYCPYVTNTPSILLGIRELTAGSHKLTVEIIGANEKAQDHSSVGIDRIILEPRAELPEEPADSTTAIDQLYRLQQLPQLRPGVRCKMFSSYDRTGGNNDGFAGTYSQLWLEEGNSVLATMDGPGCIQRIWFTHSQIDKPGLLNFQGEHIKIYLDGQEEPAVDIPLEDLFSGRLPQFPKPLVGEGQGGYYCYVPIPYRQGCKVVVEGTGVRFYQITYSEFPNAEDVRSFRMKHSPAKQASLDSAVRTWSELGKVNSLGLDQAEEMLVDLKVASGQSSTIELPAGPRMVRAVLLEGTPEQLGNAIGARLQIRWEGAKSPAVDLPLEYFFCQALASPPYRSLLAGANEKNWYNFMPMPYRGSGKLTLTAKEPLQARLRVVTEPLGSDQDDWEQGDWGQDDLGYFHALYREELPVQPDRHYTFLKRSGKGHYIGTYLVTEGQTDNKLPLWLEGDDRFTIDGQLTIHGTGSEDYFNCGWYAVEGRLNGPGGMPQHGFPVYRLAGKKNQAVAYRWHVTDPVHYESSLTAEMEHGPDNRQAADYRSGAFFYEPKP